MSLTKSYLDFQDFKHRSLVSTSAILAANAGSTEVFARAVPTNKVCMIRGVMRAVDGIFFAPFAVTADFTTDLLTKVAHGLVTGQPVYIKASVTPGGVTLDTTIYYVNAASADTLKLYTTKANAVTGSGTGLVDIVTSNGTAVFVYPALEEAFYTIFGAVTNRNGNVSAIGSVTLVANEEVAAWDATITADNTNKTAQIKFTPDPTLQTRVHMYLELWESSVDIQPNAA